LISFSFINLINQFNIIQSHNRQNSNFGQNLNREQCTRENLSRMLNWSILHECQTGADPNE